MRSKTGMKRKQPSKPTASATFASSEIQHIEQLLRFMSEHNLEEFEYSHGDLKIRLKKPSAGTVVGVPRQMAAPEIIVASGAATQGASTPPAAPPPQTPEARSTDDLHLVKSPIVGTFYRSSEPEAAPFVEIGSAVKKGQVLCIIEAMKLMNEIDSEYDGEIVNVYVETGQPVQYGERLFAIRTT